MSPAPKSGDLEASDELRMAHKELKVERDRADSLARQEPPFSHKCGRVRVTYQALLLLTFPDSATERVCMKPQLFLECVHRTELLESPKSGCGAGN